MREDSATCEAFKRASELEKVENKLILNLLGKILALYLIKNSKTPLSELIEEIFDAEMQVGDFVSRVLRTSPDQSRDLRGVLGNTIAIMPMGKSFERAVPKPTQSKNKNELIY